MGGYYDSTTETCYPSSCYSCVATWAENRTGCGEESNNYTYNSYYSNTNDGNHMDCSNIENSRCGNSGECNYSGSCQVFSDTPWGHNCPPISPPT